MRSTSRRRRLLTAACAALAPLSLTPSLGQAQGAVTLDQFRTAESPRDGFALSRPTVLPHLGWGAQLVLDYAYNPLVYETSSGSSDSEKYSVVQHQLVGTAMFSLGLVDRLTVFAGIPVSLVMRGQTAPYPGLPEADGTMVGDPLVGARVRILGEDDDRFALGAQAALSFPLAQAVDSSQQYAGDGTVVFLPRVMGEVRWERFRLNLQVGGRFRGLEDVGSLKVGQELTYGAGFTYHAMPDELDVVVEAYGAAMLGNGETFNRENVPLEALAGVRYFPTPCWVAGLAGGTGLTRGYGSPDFRGVASVGYVGGGCGETTETLAPPVDDDADDDGIVDSVDACPNDPEDLDSFEDENGCPDPDNDSDLVLDGNDGAPNDPEDRDGWQDDDGVPDPDNDGDGILDADDRCPNEAEDRDGIADDDGCPETDADADTIVDPEDHCPTTPGVTNPTHPECGGCPELACMIQGGTIEILQRVEFATNRDVILDRSAPVLEAVRTILATNPQIRRIRIEGHTDSRGNDAANLDLSRRRAASVATWLREHGIAAERLESEGFGETRPIDDNGTDAGRQNNRRVEFHIVDPAPGAGNDQTIRNP